MRLKTAAGWNQTDADWKLLLELSRGGSFAAIVDKTVVGTVTLAEYEGTVFGHVGWIGMVLVNPDFRRRGIATSLMKYATSTAQDFDVIGLDATPQGRPVYERLGFETIGIITRWERSLNADSKRFTAVNRRPASDTGDASASRISFDPEPRRSYSPIPAESLRGCITFDAEVSGFNRPYLIETFYSRTPAISALVMTDREIDGFLVGRRGSNAIQLGPVAAKTDCVFDLLLSTLLPRVSDQIYIDVYDDMSNRADALVAHGFTRTREFARMLLNPHADGSIAFPQTRPEAVAITGPEYG